MLSILRLKGVEEVVLFMHGDSTEQLVAHAVWRMASSRPLRRKPGCTRALGGSTAAPLREEGWGRAAGGWAAFYHRLPRLEGHKPLDGCC